MTDRAAPADDRPGVAFLLAAAAVVAALIGLQAARLSGQSGSERQRVTVDEVLNSFGITERIRFVYGVQVPLAVDIRQAEFLADALLDAASESTGADRAALLAESAAQAALANSLAAVDGTELARDEYRTTGGGFNVGQRLADEMSDLSIRDPAIAERRAGDLDRQALVVASALIPAAVALGCGSLAQVARRRRPLATAGWIALGIAGLVALAATVVM